ncbi:hypothetical protein C8R44DRAFT_871634 [Mycena epipterygia]|nr:hypothetical protein C8R44DRAFT_871634 [Mycena epipterygia]
MASRADPILAAQAHHAFSTFSTCEPAADIILRSADGTLFRVPSITLRRTTGYTELHEEPVPASTLAYVLCILCGLPSPIEDLDFDTVESALALASRWAAATCATR